MGLPLFFMTGTLVLLRFTESALPKPPMEGRHQSLTRRDRQSQQTNEGRNEAQIEAIFNPNDVVSVVQWDNVSVARRTRQAGIQELCMLLVKPTMLVSTTADDFRTALQASCKLTFPKEIQGAIEAVDCKKCKDEIASWLSDKACDAAGLAVNQTAMLHGIDAEYCAAFAAEAVPDIDKEMPEWVKSEVMLLDATAGSCASRSGAFCFPEDATVVVHAQGGVKVVALKDLQAGDHVQTADAASGSSWFTEVLTDWHAERDHEADGIKFIMLTHSHGSINITADHFIATKEHSFIPAAEVKIGDALLWQTEDGLVSSQVTAVQNVTKRGMYAPVTWNGRLLVNNVLASSYVAVLPPVPLGNAVQYLGWDGLHSLIHIVALPIRLAHALRVPPLLDSITRAPGIKWLKCIIAACNENAGHNPGGTTLPRYVGIAESVFVKVFTVLPRLIKLD